MTALDSRAARLLTAAIRLPSVIARCEEELVTGIARWPAIRFAMVSMIDGGPFVARAIDGDTPSVEMAALTNDLIHTTQAIGKTFDTGDLKHVAIELDHGTTIVARVPNTHGLFVLTIVGDQSSSMGMTLRAAMDLSQRLSQCLESSVTPKQAST